MKEQVIWSPSKIGKDNMEIYGAGLFGEESFVINKAQATLLFAELWKFLEIGGAHK